MWTQFWDMHSGGGLKEPPYDKIYIEAPEETAKVVFYNRFGHSAERVSCTCCGEDYSVSEYVSLEEATAYHRHLRAIETIERDPAYNHIAKGHKYLEPGEPMPEGWQISQFSPHTYYGTNRGGENFQGLTLKKYLAEGTALVIRASDIKTEERFGTVPEQGYVWQD